MKALDTSSAREPGLDLMRAIAILWVMLWHMHFALRPGLSFLAAFVLYIAIERPFLRLRERIAARTAKSAQMSATG